LTVADDRDPRPLDIPEPGRAVELHAIDGTGRPAADRPGPARAPARLAHVRMTIQRLMIAAAILAVVRAAATECTTFAGPSARTSIPRFNLDLPAAFDVVKRHFQNVEINQGKRSGRVNTRGRDDGAGIDDQSVRTLKPHRLMGVADDQELAIQIQ
jgi:hypothetical protein